MKTNKEEKLNWKDASAENREQVKSWMKEFAAGYQKDSKVMLEFLKFGSQFYRYSAKNTMLIYMQNPHALFVQSFKAWNDMGARIQKGQKGMKVYVPKQVTILKTEPEVSLKYASREQKEAYKNGQLKGYTRLSFGLGNVWDIAQTDYPAEKYPELVGMGTNSIPHEQWIKIISAFAEEKLGCTVRDGDVQSIALRGYYQPGIKEIVLNERLNDTEKLSTLTHEFGHLLTVRDEISGCQKELEADMISIMMLNRFGLEIPEGRRKHYAEHFQMVCGASAEKVEEEMDQILESVFRTYKETCDQLEVYQAACQEKNRIQENPIMEPKLCK